MRQTPNPNRHAHTGDAASAPHPHIVWEAVIHHPCGQSHHGAGEDFGGQWHGTVLLPCADYRAECAVLQQPIVKTGRSLGKTHCCQQHKWRGGQQGQKNAYGAQGQ